ncbi:MAG TPA: amylo-alpha-1,6-glucosidase [Casimicrobiaceae bacterium]|nr:amylo-alpha-1,6-glucosidase [Casimicrobiaceae bacterium]
MLPPPLVFDWAPDGDPAFLRDREWLVTNGLGGYASGTLLGIGTRRYHGLFVPNLADPKGRHIMISRFDEEIDVDGRCVRLGGAEFLDGRLETDVHRCLTRFTLDAMMPTWRFELGARVIEKTIVMPQYQNTVCVSYRLVSGAPLVMRLRPFAAFRRQDAVLAHEEDWPFVFAYSHGRHEIHRSDGHLSLRFGLRPAQGVFVCDAKVGRNVLYRVEQLRGYDHSENVFSPGYFEVELHPGAPLSFVATTQGWQALEIDGAAAVAAERQRVERLLGIAAPGARIGFAAQLTAAADQFIVMPGSRLEETLQAGAAGDEVRTVIAGYHWFGDWGRDTMISLEGLTLCTGRWREAGAILRTFSHYVRDGLLPNLFPEGAREALYHTVDATLWYFHAIDRYTRVTRDTKLVRELYPVLRDIVAHHVRGTLFNIGVDPADELVHAGAPGYQLTWMDAKVGDWVVTPRRGKPVEIQALWYNALCLMAEWARESGDDAERYAARAARVAQSFEQRFWNPAGGYLNDVVDGEQGDDPSCRPNQVFAISLRHPVLGRAHWGPVLDTVRAKLLTPYGLRTLSPDHPDYKATYHGDLRARDAAYHQGTVWPWLIGHFVDALQKHEPGQASARGLLNGFADHLRDAGVGSISEIFDAQAPYLPRGCIAQAWSVAEVLRAWLATQVPASAEASNRALATPAD